MSIMSGEFCSVGIQASAEQSPKPLSVRGWPRRIETRLHSCEAGAV